MNEVTYLKWKEMHYTKTKRNDTINQSVPEYEEALRNDKRRKIVMAISQMQGIANFSNIEKKTGIKANVLTHNLNVLQKFGVIDKITKGTYRLRYKTPLCFVCQEQLKKIDIAYIGLLGNRETRDIPETAIAIDLLSKSGFHPDLVYVSTSIDGIESWKNLKLPYYWITFYDKEIFDIDSIKKKIRPQLITLLRDYLVILDCTSGTKPATIAYYELAYEYLVPMVYVYEKDKRLEWVISIQNLVTKILH